MKDLLGEPITYHRNGEMIKGIVISYTLAEGKIDELEVLPDEPGAKIEIISKNDIPSWGRSF